MLIVIARLSYSDLVAGAVACPVCDAQKPGGGSLSCSIANTKPKKERSPLGPDNYSRYLLSFNL